ncbi:hypothetical protein OAP14_02655 [Aliiglaciecola sp.]|nr:hypothetical protein [Aliiglaciecola sp.]
MLKNLVLACTCLIASLPAYATSVYDDTVTYTYASSKARLLWPEGGFEKFHQRYAKKLAEFEVKDTDKERGILVAIPATRLAPQIMISLSQEGKTRGVIDFFSTEKDAYKAPQFVYELNGKKRLLVAQTDAFIAAKDRKTKSKANNVRSGKRETALLYFVFPDNVDIAKIRNPQLFLTTTKRQIGNANISINKIDYSPATDTVDNSGIADRYILDKGILEDPSVYFADDFDQQGWLSGLKDAVGMSKSVWKNQGELVFVDHKQVRHFSGDPGKAVLMPFRTNRNLAGNLDYYFAQHHGKEPEEAYFRYYTMLAPGSQVTGGGKLPGFAGTYNQAGWGGRANNGENGWSARGSFYETINASIPNVGGQMPIGSYIYEVDTKNRYGKPIPWGHQRSTLKPGNWVSVEQYLKLNTPEKSDGILTVWIDGVKIYHRKNLHFRNTDKLKIEKVWFNFYFGGTAKPGKNFDMYIDNIVIAKSYIGPIRK